MGSLDSIYPYGSYEKKRRPSRDASIVHLVAAVLLVSMVIYLWHLSGCPWTNTNCLCDSPPSEYFLILPDPSPPALQVDDFNRLIDLDDFTFLMNNQTVCNGSNPILLTLVHSHPGNYAKRFTIRNTWGSIVSKEFKVLFLVGIPGSKRLQTSLEKENMLYGDLVQGNFIDAYRNMTYKHVMALKWASYFCPNSKYVLKTDDDVFINSPALLDYVSQQLMPYSLNKLMFCSALENTRVKRTSRSKWKVKFREYRHTYYPTYCEGFAILYSADVVFTLYAEAQFSSYFWIDDVHITGFLAARANFKHTPFGNYLLTKEFVGEFLRDKTGNNSYLVGPYNISKEDIEKLWYKVFFEKRVGKKF